MYILDMYIFGNVMNINSLPATVICPVLQWDGLHHGRCRLLKNVQVHEFEHKNGIFLRSKSLKMLPILF